MAVQLVGRLEGHHPPTRAGEGEEQRLQHLVRAVGGEDLLGRHAVQRADRLAEVGRGAVGVAVPLHAGQLGRERVPPRRRRRLGRLVGVEADPRPTPGASGSPRAPAGRRARARGSRPVTRPPSRSRIESACAGSCSSSASATTWPPTLRSAGLVQVDDVDVLGEVGDGQRLTEAGRAERRQHVRRAGHVVAHAGRRPRAGEHRAGVADERDERVGVGHHQLEVLGGDGVADGDRVRRRVDEDGVAALGERGLDVARGGGSSRRGGRRRGRPRRPRPRPTRSTRPTRRGRARPGR